MTFSLPTLKADSLILGGGCFWCLDAAYRLMPGVTNVVSGYAGGTLSNPSYEDVCGGDTGHAEVVKIEYDPKQVTQEALLDFFWKAHDASQVDGQGADHGPQYRSIILYTSEAQKAFAEASKAAAQKEYSDTIVTQIVPLVKFWPAEDYHQDYFAKHPNGGYCSMVIRPKVAKLKHLLEKKP